MPGTHHFDSTGHPASQPSSMSTTPPSPMPKLQIGIFCPDFYIDARDLNAGCHARAAGTPSPSHPAPQSETCLLLICKFCLEFCKVFSFSLHKSHISLVKFIPINSVFVVTAIYSCSMLVVKGVRFYGHMPQLLIC